MESITFLRFYDRAVKLYMSPFLIILVFLFFVFIFSQFGGKLAARSAMSWWFVVIFLGISAVSPELLRPLANLLGIQLISNFVLGSMMLFLLFQGLEFNSGTTKAQRKFREYVSAFSILDWRTRTPEHTTQNTGRILVVVPCFNEALSLPTVVNNLLTIQKTAPIDILVVNDGSSDSSDTALRQFGRQIMWAQHLTNIGVAGVLLSGFKIGIECNYDFIIQFDGDGQHPAEEIPRMIKIAENTKADLLIGSRYTESNGNNLESTTWLRRAGSLLIYFTLKIFKNTAHISDPTSGFRIYSKNACRALAQAMPDEYPEPESIAILALLKYNINEIYVKMHPRTTGFSSISGFQTVRFMIKITSALFGLRLRSIYKRSGAI